MTEAVLNWPVIFDAIVAEIAAVRNVSGQVAFEQVLVQEPMGLPLGGPYAFAWYGGREDARTSGGARKTFGNVMYAAVVELRFFWPVRPERESGPGWEAEIATVDTAMRRAFRANSTINSNVTDLEIEGEPPEYAYLPIPGGANRGLYRMLALELVLDNLEGEAIAP